MAIGLEVLVSNIASLLQNIAPIIAVILVILGGIVYGLSQTQPAEMRGKWQTAAISMFIGGIIIAVISMSAQLIVNTAGTALKPV